MIQVFKIVNQLNRVDTSDLFKLQASVTRGHKWKIHKGKAIKQQRVNSFSQRVINDWNSLPANIVEAANVNAFKNKLDKHWEQSRYNATNAI